MTEKTEPKERLVVYLPTALTKHIRQQAAENKRSISGQLHHMLTFDDVTEIREIDYRPSVPEAVSPNAPLPEAVSPNVPLPEAVSPNAPLPKVSSPAPDTGIKWPKVKARGREYD